MTQNVSRFSLKRKIVIWSIIYKVDQITKDRTHEVFSLSAGRINHNRHLKCVQRVAGQPAYINCVDRREERERKAGTRDFTRAER